MCPFVWRDLNQILWCMKWFKQIAMVMYDVFTSQAHEWCLPQPVPGENASNLSEEAKLAGNFWSLGLSAFVFDILESNGWGDVCIDVHVMLRWIRVYIYNMNKSADIHDLQIYYIINKSYLIDQICIYCSFLNQADFDVIKKCPGCSDVLSLEVAITKTTKTVRSIGCRPVLSLGRKVRNWDDMCPFCNEKLKNSRKIYRKSL